MMKFPIKTVLDKMRTAENFILIDGHPVWAKKKQYGIFRRFFNEGNLRCVICGTEADHFKFLKCKGPGSLLVGERKFTFKLYDKNHNIFTLDHWIPKWITKKLRIKLNHNLVPMCDKCNSLKGHMLPIHFNGRETPLRWRKCYAQGV